MAHLKVSDFANSSMISLRADGIFKIEGATKQYYLPHPQCSPHPILPLSLESSYHSHTPLDLLTSAHTTRPLHGLLLLKISRVRSFAPRQCRYNPGRLPQRRRAYFRSLMCPSCRSLFWWRKQSIPWTMAIGGPTGNPRALLKGPRPPPYPPSITASPSDTRTVSDIPPHAIIHYELTY